MTEIDDRRRALASSIDKNHDGRLQSSEFVEELKGTIRRCALASIATNGHCSGGLIISALGTWSQKENFERVKSELAAYFPNGIEDISPAQLAELQGFANTEKMQVKNCISFAEIKMEENPFADQFIHWLQIKRQQEDAAEELSAIKAGLSR